MIRIAACAAAAIVWLSGDPARAAEADLCAGLKSAWSSAKTDPASVRDVRLAGADRCSFSDNDLRCFWIFAGPDQARRTYDGFRAVATACFAPLGFTAAHKVLSDVETTSLEAPVAEQPNVDIFYPIGRSLVGISIITAD